MAKMLWEQSEAPTVSAFLAAWVFRRMPEKLIDPADASERANWFDTNAARIIQEFAEQGLGKLNHILLRARMYYVADGMPISRSPRHQSVDVDHDELLQSEPTFAMLSLSQHKAHYRTRDVSSQLHRV